LISEKYKKLLNININSHAYLRPININDINQQYIVGLNDPDVNRFLVSAKENKVDLESIRSYVKTNWLSKNAILFGFFFKNKLCGTVRLHDISEKKSFIGMVIFDKKIWKQGWGKEILFVMNNYAYEELGLREIRAGVAFDNYASIKLFSAAGYIKDVHYSGQDKFIYVKTFDGERVEI